MKKVLISALLIFFSLTCVNAEDSPVYLQLDSEKSFPPVVQNYSKSTDFKPAGNSESDNLEKILFYNEDDRLKSKSFSKSVEKQFGRTTLGTTFSNDVKVFAKFCI